jgi:hypothetical protein
VSASLHHHRGERPRDPRLDPQPGDRLERGTLTRTVEDVDLFGNVTWRHELGAGVVSATAWRLWSRGARVVRRAEGESMRSDPTAISGNDESRVSARLSPDR